nr:leucine-rich repeat protein [Lachnospiraceae bacterium]
MKKFICVSLSIMMILSHVPAAAFAAEADNISETSAESAAVEAAVGVENAETVEAVPEEAETSLPAEIAAEEAEPAALENVTDVAEPAAATEATADTKSTVASGTCGDSLTWTLDSTGVLTIQGSGAMTDYTSSSSMPWYSNRSSIKTLVIGSGATKIGDYAFNGCSNITSVDIPDTVTAIGIYAFENCSKLTSVSIPEGVKTVNICAFGNCTSLAKVSMPASATLLYSSVFTGCSKLITAGPSGSGCNYEFAWTTTIPMWAFHNCSSLTTITLPESVTKIELEAFRGCSSLTSINIPASATSFESNVFSGCTSLTTAGPIRSGCNIEFGWETSIPAKAFHNHSSLESIILPTTLTSIGSNAFYTCTGLKDVYYPGSQAEMETFRNNLTVSSGNTSFSSAAMHYEYISRGTVGGLTWVLQEGNVLVISGTGAMTGTYEYDDGDYYPAYPWPNTIEELIIEEGVTSVSTCAFEGCKNLTKVTLPSTLTAIGIQAFRGCSALEEIELPEGLLTINGSAFENCTSLTELVIPASVTGIYTDAINGCTALTALSYAGTGEQWISLYKNDSQINQMFIHCLADDTTVCGGRIGSTSGTTFWEYSEDGTLTVSGSGAIPDYFNTSSNGNNYPDRPWENIPYTKLVVEEGITKIGWRAFAGASSLVSVQLPSTLTEIKGYRYYSNHVGAFSFCTALESIEIPEGVTKIGCFAFMYCNNLKSIIVPESVTIIGYGSFYGCTSLETIWYRCTSDQRNRVSVDSQYDGSSDGSNHSSASVLANVTEYVLPNSFSISESSLTMGIGSSTTLEASILPEDTDKQRLWDGTNMSALPSDIVWSSSDENIVSVENGVVTAKEAGSAVITASLGDLTADCEVTVASIPAEGIALNKTSLTLYEGYTEQLTVTFTPAGTSNKTLYWSSSNTNVATVEDGLVTSVDGGTAIITVISDDGGFFATCTVKVLDIIDSGVCGENLTWIITGDGDEYTLHIMGSGDMYDFYETSPWNEYSLKIRFIEIEKGATSIGWDAFSGCSSLTEVNIPEGVTRIMPCALKGCRSLTTVTIPEGVTSLGSGVFSECTSLTEVTIPESVTGFGDSVFQYCESLSEVILPEGLIDLGDYTFYGCTSLLRVNIPESLTFIGDDVFDGCISLIDVTIPETITSIGIDAFRDCTSLTEVTIPNDVTSIGSAAFNGCSSLSTVTIPEGLISLGSGAFRDCISLTEISIPDGLTSIEEYTFCGCSSLREVTIPNDVTSIGSAAFYECTSLYELFISENLTSLGSYAFSNCSSLSKVSIPDSVTSIGDHAFSECRSLAEVILPRSMTEIADGVFRGCRSLTEVTIPDGVISIGDSAFYYCTSLEKIIVPGSVASIEERTFANCSNMSDAILVTGVETIGENAFNYCGQLQRVSIPDSVNEIGGSAFAYSGVNYLFFYGTECDWSKVAVDENNDELTNAERYLVLFIDSMEYSANGEAIIPQITVIKDGITLIEGTDYTISCRDNINAGLAWIDISFMGSYADAGIAEIPFTITPLDASGGVIGNIASVIYTGEPLTPALEVTLGGQLLEEGKDYTVQYSNNVNAGTATATVTFTGIYQGTLSRDFTINPADASNAVIEPIPDQIYTGSARTPEVVISLDGKVLKLGTDYTVTYTNNVNKGTARVFAVFINNYTHAGTLPGSFKITDTLSTHSGAATKMDISGTDASRDVSATVVSSNPGTGFSFRALEQTSGSSGWRESYEVVFENAGTYSLTFANSTDTAGQDAITVMVAVEDHTWDTEKTVDTEATCTSDGQKSLHCSVCGAIKAGSEEVIPALGHDYQFSKFVWEGYTATALYVCANDSEHTVSYDAEITSAVTAEATCDTAGVRTYTATYDGHTDTKTEEIAALGHDYKLTEWTWSEDHSSATATFTCANDASHVQTVTATVSSETTAATCEAAGKTVYTATVTFEGETYTDTKEVEIEALGHDYKLSGWTWADEYSSAEATFTCANDAGHVQTVTATVSSVTTPATCGAAGKTVYTATVTFEGEAYTDTKEVVIPATGHDWGEVTYTWSDDNSTVTATRTCANDSSHVETETVNTTSEVTKAATCEAKGETTYTAVFENEAFETQTKTLANIDALGHNWGEPVWKWQDDNSSGSALFTCANDKDHEYEAEFTTVTTEQGTGDDLGYTLYIATVVGPDGKVYSDTRKVINQYTITFDTAGGSEVESFTADYGTAVTAPEDPDREGYTFDGWTPEIPSTMPAENLTVTAVWTPVTYTITYVLDGGTNAASNPESYTIETDTIDLANATRAGYTFGGWYSDSEFRNQVSQIIKGSTGNVTLYAKWTTDDYTITYNLGGGLVAQANPTAYSITTETFTLNNPTREGYTFAGWTGTDLEEATITVTVTKGSMGDREYTATWTANSYTIVYNANGGNGTMADISAVYDQEVVLTENAFERAGYTFTGWNTAADGSGTAYEDGAAVKNLAPEGSVTLYAQWTAREDTPYSVEHYFEKLDGGYNIITQMFEGATDAEVTAKPLTMKGFTFDEDNEANVITGTVAADGSLVLKLYYTRNSYTVTFLDEDGTVLQTGKVKYEAVPECEEPAKAATADTVYTFAGWTPEIAAVSGDAIYTATYTSAAQVYTIDEDSWAWTGSDEDGYTAAEVTFRAGAGDFTTVVKATVTSETTAATCETARKTVYTATATYGGKTYTDTREVAIPATGHDWNEATYTWAEDNSEVTASRTCKNDPSHIETETVNTTVAETAATCETAGSAIYTAAFTNEAFETQTKTVEIAALGHDLVHHDRVEPTKTTVGYEEYWECTRCGKLFSDAEGTHEIEAPVEIPCTWIPVTSVTLE